MNTAVLKTILKILVLGVLVTILVALVQRALPPTVGTSDFIGYWAGARLLLTGQDPYDADSILRVQREVYPERDQPMFTWNPPWLGVLMLPLGALPFDQATHAWLLANTLLIGISSLAIWRLFDQSGSGNRAWIALPITFLFAQTLAALDTGQITTLMLVGVTGFLAALRLNRKTLAGVFLALTSVKPHLLFLWLPLIVLWTIEHRTWRVWFGFGLTMSLWLIVLTAVRPSWPADYAVVLLSPPVRWATPTLGGAMAATWGLDWGRYIGLLLLPLLLPFWRRIRNQSLEVITVILLPLSLGLAIFGWSYDQILLLIPILAMAVILIRGERSKRDSRITVLVLTISALVLLAQRFHSTDEVYYFWVPWMVLLTGAWVIRPRSVIADTNGMARTSS